MSPVQKFNETFGFSFTEPVHFKHRLMMQDYARHRGNVQLAGQLKEDVRAEIRSDIELPRTPGKILNPKS